MLKRLVVLGIMLFAGLGVSAFGQGKTVVNDAKAKTMLLGKHKLSLQWISWDYFGTATVTNKGGVLYLKGEQKGRGNNDFVRINGVIKEVNAKSFVFDGTVVTQVSTINNGEPCTRDGEMTFRITGKRKYWRLQDIDNPCDEVADYVDLFFR
ncbi:MAG: hypothetical protein IPJ30_11550 [Acidobacteria bacterium]|nr:hypothetical protein [Acidobacteriota bacterium]MBK8149869.1 hypothetical protein [Acidobacteriota bacterium]